MKKLISLAAIALAVCIAFVSCTKEETGGTVTVNGDTFTNVTATVQEGRGLWFQFVLDKDKNTNASAQVDAQLALERTLKIGDIESGDGGYGDWVCLAVEYGNGKVYTAEPASGTQTIKKVKNAYTVKVDG
ncbi:MAG: hypothetical protein IKZ60_05215, partial [Bacteroidales bacterium]|nr:hypothetical protein [Bacteroidales bacterium]